VSKKGITWMRKGKKLGPIVRRMTLGGKRKKGNQGTIKVGRKKKGKCLTKSNRKKAHGHREGSNRKYI